MSKSPVFPPSAYIPPPVRREYPRYRTRINPGRKKLVVKVKGTEKFSTPDPPQAARGLA